MAEMESGVQNDLNDPETATGRMAGVIAAEEAMSIPTSMLSEEIVDAVGEMFSDEVTTALAEVGVESLFNEVAVMAGAAVLDEAIGGIMGYFHLTYSAYRGIAKEGTGRKALVRTGAILACGIAGGFIGSTGGGLAGESIETLLGFEVLAGIGVTVGGICGAVAGKVGTVIGANVLVDKYLR